MKKSVLLIACAGLIVGGMGLVAPKSADAGIQISFGTGSYGYANQGYGYYRGHQANHFTGYNQFNRGGLLGNNFHGRPVVAPFPGRGPFDTCPSLLPRGRHQHGHPGHRNPHRGWPGFGW